MSENPERYQQIFEAVKVARLLSGQDLEEFLSELGANDEAMKARVLELLELGSDEERDDPFVESSVANAREALEEVLDGEASASWLPERIGDYTILQRIGQGGMGIVFEAEQQTPRRRVAIKLLSPTHATPERLKRFHRETELLGRLQHPGIAQIYSAGTYLSEIGEQPFLAMELVCGKDIIAHCDAAGLDRRARIELWARVADAVQYAHERGVIHRDLKPDNVLVDDSGRPKILDFGIARARERSETLFPALTQDGQMLGTLSYMAPEQLRLAEGAITPKVDVYALGVIGFELIVGRLPHVTEALATPQAVAYLADAEAPRASLFDVSLRGDLETILGKALESQRSRRYASAGELADDLRRYLEARPILARPPSGAYLARKFVQRHRALVLGVLSTLIVAAIGTVVATRFAIDANRNAAEANQRADALERATYVSGVAAVGAAIDQQDYRTAAAQLELLPERRRGWEFDYLRARLVHHLDEWDSPPQRARNPVFDPAGERMFAVLEDGSIGTWDVATGTFRGSRRLGRPESEWDVALSGPLLRFAVISDDRILIGDLDSGELTATIEPVTSPGEPIRPRICCWDPSGKKLLYQSGDARVWDGTSSRTLPDTDDFLGGTLEESGERAAFSGRGFGMVWLHDVLTGTILASQQLDDDVKALAFSPRGDLLAVSSSHRNVYLLDAHTLEIRARLLGHQGQVDHVVWTADGTRLVSTARDGTLRIWNVERGSAQVCTVGPAIRADLPGSVPVDVALTPDGERVVATGGRIQSFPIGEPNVLRGHETYVYYLTFSPDGSMLASTCYGVPEVRVWDVHRTELIREIEVPTNGAIIRRYAPIVAFSNDGQRLVAACLQGIAHRDTRTWSELPITAKPNLNDGFFQTLGRRIWGASGANGLSPSGDRYLTCIRDRVRILDDIGPLPEAEPNAYLQSVSPPFPHDGTMSRYLVGHDGEVYCATFSPDGTRIATGGNDATVRLWDAETGEQLLVLRGHQQYVFYVAFSPDGTLLASASGDKTIRLWDTLPLIERRARGRVR